MFCGQWQPPSLWILRVDLQVVVEKHGRRLKHVVVSVVPMKRSSSSYTSEPGSRMMCLCNVEVPLVTSWTEDNPGRHFYGCGLYKVGKWCNYFEWHDLVANSRQKRIIVALMKKVDELNLREKDLYTKISDMKMKGKFLGIGLRQKPELNKAIT
ncbi:hypothetical protein GmHk_U059750 [Glycine max]|nr:hypothetical protein GmHk_U059750 [Glycine max]